VLRTGGRGRKKKGERGKRGRRGEGSRIASISALLPGAVQRKRWEGQQKRKGGKGGGRKIITSQVDRVNTRKKGGEQGEKPAMNFREHLGVKRGREGTRRVIFLPRRLYGRSGERGGGRERKKRGLHCGRRLQVCIWAVGGG